MNVFSSAPENRRARLRDAGVYAGKTALVLAAAVCAYLAHAAVSCSVTPSGIAILTGDFAPPALVSFYPESGTEIALGFTEPARITALHVTGADGEFYCEAEQRDEGAAETQRARLARAAEPGARYRLSGAVEDAHGNTLSFSAGFSGYNGDVPRLIISEVRPRYSKPRAEFIELYALTAGNLSGVTVQSAHEGAEALYEFPPCRVAAGEYIVLHCRSLDEGARDETGADTAYSEGADASPGRDFWIPGSAKRIDNYHDVITLRERAGGHLMDAVVFAMRGTGKKDDITPEKWESARQGAAEEAFAAGLWSGGSALECAADSAGNSPTKTLQRNNIAEIAASASYSGGEQNGPKAWQVAKHTPGAANN